MKASQQLSPENSAWTIQPWKTPHAFADSFLSAITRSRSPNKWKSLQRSSGTIAKNYLIAVVYRNGQTTNRYVNKETINKRGIAVANGVTAVRTCCITEASQPCPTRPRRRTQSATVVQLVPNLHHSSERKLRTTKLFVWALRHQESQTWQKIPGLYTGCW